MHYGIQYLVKYDLMLHIWANTDHLCILYVAYCIHTTEIVKVVCYYAMLAPSDDDDDDDFTVLSADIGQKWQYCYITSVREVLWNHTAQSCFPGSQPALPIFQE